MTATGRPGPTAPGDAGSTGPGSAASRLTDNGSVDRGSVERGSVERGSGDGSPVPPTARVGRVVSVNISSPADISSPAARPDVTRLAAGGTVARERPRARDRSGIDKRPVDGPVAVSDPGSSRGRSGLAGDIIGDRRRHGGSDQAVYAYAAEDLAWWAGVLGCSLPPGSFGENLTTTGLDLTEAVIGERWHIGDRLVVAVSTPRIPCRAFARRMVELGHDEPGWVERFRRRGAPGAYLRVVTPGMVVAGDRIVVGERPGHGVTVGLAFAALAGRGGDLAPLRPAAPFLPAGIRRQVESAGAREPSSGPRPR
jgi:MOSC domain-containing protein YiiM